MDGVVRTRVGYAGGSKRSPTYHDLGDHAEAVEIAFDPAKLSYEDLLKVFWESHDPARSPFSRQYASLILPGSEDQARLAAASLERFRQRRTTHAEIVPDATFWPAEDYHQKYYLQHVPDLLKEYRAMYPAMGDFIRSTAVARVYGYVGGYGSSPRLERDLGRLGLSAQAEARLLAHVRRRI